MPHSHHDRWPRIVREGLGDDGKRTHARQLNIARRHLTQAQKRDLIADDLRADPSRTDRQIAAGLGVSHHTVNGVRKDLEESGQIAHFSRRNDPRTGNQHVAGVGDRTYQTREDAARSAGMSKHVRRFRTSQVEKTQWAAASPPPSRREGPP